jgi:hypothetical protein
MASDHDDNVLTMDSTLAYKRTMELFPPAPSIDVTDLLVRD